MSKINHECGVIAAYQKGNFNLSQTIFYGLTSIQHRGQQSAGIAVCNDGIITSYKEMGLVTDVLNEKILNLLKGDMCIAHVKYSNQKQNFAENAQPISINYKNGSLAVSFNGALVNADKLRSQMEENNVIFSTTNNSEVVAALVARHDKGDIIEAIKQTMRKIYGGYAFVLMTPKKIIGVRDPKGVRPLVLGKLKNGFALASESCAFDIMNGEFIRDVRPGEIVVIENDNVTSVDFSAEENISPPKATCIFEYVYFARPDSTIDNINVYKSRETAGKILARQYPAQADIVIGVPDSGIPAAIGYSVESGIPYGVGLIKNRYIGRTFIEATQIQREIGVKIKLNPIRQIIKDKKIVLIDDSIVRGTTMKKLIKILKLNGAKEIHLRIASPPVYNTCHLGVDIHSKEALISNKFNVNDICKALGAKSLGYISIDGLLESTNGSKQTFCTGCFTGDYPYK